MNGEQSNVLPLVEGFYTIQGEGFNTGKAAYFIRLGGCDVRCPWCDSKNTWDYSSHPLINVKDIIASIKKTPARNVVITGGEPLMHNLDNLCTALRQEDYKIFLETSGTHPLSGDFDWICVSPKKHHPALDSVLEKASEIKIVITDKEDFKWAEENRLKTSKDCIHFLQPNWNNRTESTELIIEYVKNHPLWRISLQTHKFINIP